MIVLVRLLTKKLLNFEGIKYNSITEGANKLNISVSTFRYWIKNGERSSKETKKLKLSKANKGRKRSQKAKQNISKSKIG